MPKKKIRTTKSIEDEIKAHQQIIKGLKQELERVKRDQIEQLVNKAIKLGKVDELIQFLDGGTFPAVTPEGGATPPEQGQGEHPAPQPHPKQPEGV